MSEYRMMNVEEFTRQGQPNSGAQTAMDLMRGGFLLIPEDLTVGEALDMMKDTNCYAHFYNAYICSPGHILKGILDIKELMRFTPEQIVGSLPLHEPLSVPPNMDQEQVAKIVARNDLVELPVLDSDNTILGVISVDDVMDVVIQESTEDIFLTKGLERVPLTNRSLSDMSLWYHYQARIPWLMLSLAGGLLAGGIIAFFEGRLAALIVTLVIFIPFIMALGGNTGSQAATILVREITLDAVQHFWGYLVKEATIGLLIGGSIGLVTGTIAWIWQGSALVGWIVGLSSLAVFLAGVVIGVLIPWIFNIFDLDTAIGSGPVVTTLKDITGLLIYFGIAAIILSIAK